MKGLIFTYGLTYGGPVLSLFSPFIGLLIYVAFAILRPDSLWHWSVPQGNYSRIVACGLLLGWMLHGFGNWRFGKAAPIVYSLLGYMAISVLSALCVAEDKQKAWAYVETLGKIVLPFVVGLTTIDSLKKLKQLAWVIVSCQGYLAIEFNLTFYSGVNRLWEAGFGSLDNNGVAIALVTCIGLALLLMFLAFDGKRWWQMGAWLALILAMVNAVMFSYSRGGMLALGITGLAAFILLPQKKLTHYIVLVIVLALGVRLAGEEVQKRFWTIFDSDRDASADSRLKLWGSCLEVMMQSPTLGIGPDQWPLVAHLYGFTRGKQAHTTWLRVAAEVGAIGFACYVMFYAFTMKRLWAVMIRRDLPDPWYRYLASGVIAACIGFVISAQFVSVEFLELPYYVVLIGAGILKLLSVPNAASPSNNTRTVVRRVPTWAVQPAHAQA